MQNFYSSGCVPYRRARILINQNFFLIASLFLLLCFPLQSLASQSEILINQETRSLVAPKGATYKWYLNSFLLKGKSSQNLKVSKSGIYTVEYITNEGVKARQNAYILVQAATIIKVYIIGDSTVMTYGGNLFPEAGWGQIIPHFFNSNLQFINRAIGGRSSKSFHVEGRWTPIRDSLKTGDFVFIQFGHNDRDFSKPERYADTAIYKQYLRIYCNETKAKGAHPVLITPMILNAWNGTTLRNVFTEGANDYRGAMIQVANQLNVPYIDVNMKSFNLFKTLPRDYLSNFIYLGLKPGEYPNFPNGVNDFTHFQEMGAIEITKLLTQGISEQSSHPTLGLLAPNLKPTLQVATSTTNTAAGLYTRSNTFPSGVNVTVKMQPNASFAGQKWTDAANATVTSNSRYSFIMGTTARSYKANFVASSSITVQESSTGFCGVDGTIDNNNAGFTGTGFANGNNTIAAGIKWSVNAPASGLYSLTWRHSNGTTIDRTGRVLVNTVSRIPSLSFPSTTNFTTWAEVSANVYLSAGVNNIRLESTTANGLSNIDYLKVNGLTPTPLSCTGTSFAQATSMNELQLAGPNNALAIYPNPSKDHFNIQMTGEFAYVITDLNGKTVEKGKGKDESKVGNNLPAGVYILNISVKGEPTTIKIIKD